MASSSSNRHNSTSDRNRFLQVLGLSSGATEEEIQQAYRRLALTHHPDKNNNDPDATRKFQEINNAYRILTTGETRDDSEDNESHSPFGMQQSPFFTADDPLLNPRFAEEMSQSRENIRRYADLIFTIIQEDLETERNRQRPRNRSEHEFPSWAGNAEFNADGEFESPFVHESRHQFFERGDEASYYWQRDRGNLSHQNEARQNYSSGKCATGGSSRQRYNGTTPKNQKRRARKGKRYRNAGQPQEVAEDALQKRYQQKVDRIEGKRIVYVILFVFFLYCFGALLATIFIP